MTLGEQVAEKLLEFAAEARLSGREPVSFHVGRRQYQALARHVDSRFWLEGRMLDPRIRVAGLPVWMDKRDFYLGVESIDHASVSHLERLLHL
jgi:hypothetical protein